MTLEKFDSEVKTLKRFFEFYCKNNHKEQSLSTKKLLYKEKEFTLELNLCKDCKEHIFYCFNRLLECPHEEKPRCRNCPNSCYDRIMWKKTAKLMKYSGIRLGISKIFNFKKFNY